jgi:predicted ferric reductase
MRVAAAGRGNGSPQAVPLAPVMRVDTDEAAVPSRFGGRVWGAFLAAVYPVLALTPLAILAALTPMSDRPRMAEAGVDCAIVGLTILALQFVVGGRLHWVEAPFGLDLLLVFHRWMALVAAALLCVHPLLVGWAEGWSLITRLHVPWYIWAGRMALATLLAHVAISLCRRALHLSYERWRRVHNIFALGILGWGSTHALAMGRETPGATVLLSALSAVGIGAWLHSRVIRPWFLRRHPFRVVALGEEAPRVWTIVLEPRAGRPLRFAPGQFVFLRMHGAPVPAEEHPFSIASSPNRSGQISLTIKESGDFTAQVRRIRPGNRATVHGPFGRFSHVLHPDGKERVFVAGGVGITPLMSMLRHMRDCGGSGPVLLICANRRPADMLFAAELRAMVGTDAFPWLRVVHVLSDAPPGWSGEAGRLDADRLARLCGGVAGKTFYLCCPPPMTSALVGGLRRMGVSPRWIHAEWFRL